MGVDSSISSTEVIGDDGKLAPILDEACDEVTISASVGYEIIVSVSMRLRNSSLYNLDACLRPEEETDVSL